MSTILTLLLTCATHVHAKHLLLIGETGAGKSTLGNFMLGRAAFKVGHDLKSCTTQCQTELGKLFQDDMDVKVTDTGGLGDSEGRDETFVKNVADHVRLHQGFDGILYVHNACVPRITKGAQNSMLEMLHTLADDGNRAKLWRHFGIVLTHCAMYHPLYTTQLPNELRQRFEELDFDIPIFWFVQGENTFDKVFSAMGSLWGTDFQSQINSWVKSLPGRFTMPTETKREELKRTFEENRKQELEQKRRMQDLEDQNRHLESQQSTQQRRLEEMEAQQNYQQNRIKQLESQNSHLQSSQQRRLEEMEAQQNYQQNRIQQLEAQNSRLQRDLYDDGYSGGSGRYSASSGYFAKASLVDVQAKGTLTCTDLIRDADCQDISGGFIDHALVQISSRPAYDRPLDPEEAE